MSWQKYIVKTPVTKSDKAVKNKPKEYIKSKIQLDKKRGFMAYLFRRIFPFFVLGIIYLIWLRMTHLYIPCIFHSLTELICVCISASSSFSKDLKTTHLFLLRVPLLFWKLYTLNFWDITKKLCPFGTIYVLPFIVLR